MCDVMPTISEDSISQRSSQFGDEAHFEQLMVSMLDERDKLVESLKNEQEKKLRYDLYYINFTAASLPYQKLS